MEEPEINELIAAADKRAVYINQVEHAKAKFRSLNVLYWEGHIFELHQNFIAYVYIKYHSTMPAHGTIPPSLKPDPVIFLDKNDEPVLITDLKRFFEEIEECSQEALNYYYDAYAELQTADTATELIEVCI